MRRGTLRGGSIPGAVVLEVCAPFGRAPKQGKAASRAHATHRCPGFMAFNLGYPILRGDRADAAMREASDGSAFVEVEVADPVACSLCLST